MGNGQPYMYDAPMRYSQSIPHKAFDPKAVTRASFISTTSSPPKMKPDGPLVNFNRHPDSWQPAPTGRMVDIPIPANIKKKINGARWTQLGLRIVQLVAAIGLLVLVILIKNTTDNEGWIIRLPAAADVLVTIYAIYNLSRPSKARPAASSASYHFFAICMDTGLVPFYVFTAMLAKHEWLDVPPDDRDRWVSYFDATAANDQVFQSTFLVASILGALHVLSFGLDLWLCMMFRQIARLPPDMNPLEDNLTSRRKTKHQYKNSDTSFMSDKRYSQVPKGLDMSEDQASSRVSFFHSRANQDAGYSAHTPRTAEMTRMSLVEPARPTGRLSPMPSNPTMGKRSSYQSVASPRAEDEFDEKRFSVQSKKEMQDDNWFVVNEQEIAESYDGQPEPEDRQNMRKASVDEYDPYRVGSGDGKWSAPLSNALKKTNTEYKPIPLFAEDDGGLEPQPLRMNPPTPTKPTFHDSPRQQPRLLSGSHLSPPKTRTTRARSRVAAIQNTRDDRIQTLDSAVSGMTGTDVYSDDETEFSARTSTFSTAPKGKFYGDLGAAMQGVRHQGVASPRPMSMVGSLHYAASEMTQDTASVAPSSNARTATRPRQERPKTMIDSVSGTVIKKDRADEERNVYSPNRSSPRVVSRTGVDFMGADSDLGLSRNRRDVSGKVAEEGRGGWGGGLNMRRVSGMA